MQFKRTLDCFNKIVNGIKGNIKHVSKCQVATFTTRKPQRLAHDQTTFVKL